MPPWAGPTFQSYAVTLLPTASCTRDELLARLLAKNIGAKPGIMTIHREPVYQGRCPTASLPRTEAASDRSFLLPLYPQMTDEEQDAVIAALLEAVA